ncbi:MAG: DNA-protecting protein DprA, partial [Pseudomonadota bacterium]
PLAARIRAQLSAAPIGANQLARALGAPAAEVAAAISELEIAGELIRHPGGAVGAPPPERR